MMKFVGGINHGQVVPDEQLATHCILVPDEHRTVRYLPHAGHYVIFGMTPQNAAKLIEDLPT